MGSGRRPAPSELDVGLSVESGEGDHGDGGGGEDSGGALGSLALLLLCVIGLLAAVFSLPGLGLGALGELISLLVFACSWWVGLSILLICSLSIPSGISTSLFTTSGISTSLITTSLI